MEIVESRKKNRISNSFSFHKLLKTWLNVENQLESREKIVGLHDLFDRNLHSFSKKCGKKKELSTASDNRRKKKWMEKSVAAWEMSACSNAVFVVVIC